MSKHSKNNTAKSYFTRWELDEMGYGSKTQRLGADSIKDWDACSLCLQHANTPMCCPDGHLFCKECIYKCLLHQIEVNKRRLAVWKKQEEADAIVAAQKEAEAEEAKILAFEARESSIVAANVPGAGAMNASSSYTPAAPAGSDAARAPEGYLPQKTPMGTIFVEDPAVKQAREREERIAKIAGLDPSAADNPNLNHNFWLATNTPQAQKTKVDKPDMKTYCLEGDHPIKLKQLVAVQFKAIPHNDEALESTVSGEERYQCPTCSRTLTNAHGAVVVKKCGHAFCMKCAKFLLSEKKCHTCNARAKPKDIITLQAGGTGFASRNAVEATTSSVGCY